MYIYIHTYIYTSIHINIYIYINKYINISTYLSIYLYLSIYIYMQFSLYLYICRSISISIHTFVVRLSCLSASESADQSPDRTTCEQEREAV